MPQAAPKPCTQCKTLVYDGSSRCMAHKPTAWVQRAGVNKRQTGRALQRKRAQLFSREPLCRECSKHGRVTEATIRDHITPLAEGGLDVDANTQPLCVDCHEAKTKREQGRGVGKKSPAHAPETDLVVKFSRAGNLGGGVPPGQAGGGA